MGMTLWSDAAEAVQRLLDTPSEVRTPDREILEREWAFTTLRLGDPLLVEAVLEAQFAAITERVRAAMKARALAPVRSLVSDGLYESLTAQAERGAAFEHVACGRPGLDTFTVDSLRRGPTFDVAIGRPRWNREPKSATLSWAVEGKYFFLRRRGATTRAAPPADGACPGCAAPITLTDRTRCDYCGCVVNSGEHGWILCAITEGDLEREDRTPRGLDAMCARDLAFAPETVEDRGSALFWALQGGSPKAIARFLAPGVAAPRLELPAGSPLLEDVRVIALEPGPKDDSLCLRVRWRVGEVRGVHAVGVIRPAAARTSTARGLNSLGCPRCGGPLGEAAACPWCGATDLPSSDWSVAWVEPYDPVRDTRAALEFNPPWDDRTREAVFRLLNGVRERVGEHSAGYLFLESLRRYFGIGDRRKEWLAPAESAAALPADVRATTWGFARLMFIDGRPLDERISAEIARFAAALGVADPGAAVAELKALNLARPREP